MKKIYDNLEKNQLYPEEKFLENSKQLMVTFHNYDCFCQIKNNLEEVFNKEKDNLKNQLRVCRSVCRSIIRTLLSPCVIHVSVVYLSFLWILTTVLYVTITHWIEMMRISLLETIQSSIVIPVILVCI